MLLRACPYLRTESDLLRCRGIPSLLVVVRGKPIQRMRLDHAQTEEKLCRRVQEDFLQRIPRSHYHPGSLQHKPHSCSWQELRLTVLQLAEPEYEQSKSR